MVILPPKIDVFALLIFLGVVQGVFLAYFFLRHSREAQFPNRFLGWLLLGLSLLMADIWLCYTNYMFRVIWLDDATEPVNLLIAPLVYLYFQTSLSGRFGRRQWLHFIPAGLYFLYLCLIFYPQPEALKYNAYISAFHDNLPHLPVRHYGPAWAFWLKDQIIEMTSISMVIYLTLSFLCIKKAFRREALPFFSNQNHTLVWYRKLVLQLCSIVVVFLICRLSFPDDLGDHLIAAHIAFVVYATSFGVLRQSAIFQIIPAPDPPADESSLPVRKYEKSSLTPELEENTLRKLQNLLAQEKPYLDPACSLPALSKQLAVSPHHLSQVLNDRLQLNFFEFLATHRVEEAKRLLSDPALSHLKMEEIGDRVGYSSKSAFNGVFKKLTGQTPSAFRSSCLSA